MVLPVIADQISSYRNPTRDDILLIARVIEQDEQAIVALDLEINMVMAQLEQLRLRKSQHQDNIRQSRSLITLARRIPPELLASVFELCAESGWTRAPLVASHICSAWRKATEYPRVWSYLYVNCGLGNPLAKTRLWLSKVLQAPLHITLEVPADASSAGDVLSALFEHAAQWKSVSIRTHDSVQLNYILSLMRYSFPHLRQLDCVTHWDTSAGDLIGFSALHNAPSLNRLSIELPNLPRWRIPFNLTNLHLVLSTTSTSLITASRWTSMLEDLLELKHLTLELSSDMEYHYEPDTPLVVELPRLESLTFIVSPGLLSVLDNMQSPALKRIQLRCSPGHQHTSSSPLIRRFLESSPHLQLLELYDVDLPREELEQCFSSLSHLEELRLHDSDISDEQLQLLYGPNGLCPNLTRLEVRWCAHLTGSAIVQLVRSRVNTDADKPTTASQYAKEIEEVAAINCLHVGEQDVLDIAAVTTCRLMMRNTDDFCRSRGCCLNERYRQRMRLRHGITFGERNPPLSRIIL
ncbi:hypothetical protein HYDPIDRAFT_104865 [Hydnomerulius pinastri MD-312]|nr:hypothetical protein HYDPIDRAFT_104865 [Hydnomerulius pinastri MD-312]